MDRKWWWPIGRSKQAPAPAAVAVPAATKQAKSAPVDIAEPKALRAPGLPVYPPKDGGIAIVPSADLVQSQAQLIERLRRHVSLPQAEFEALYLNPIIRLAEFVGLLPATRSANHAGAGGLFRFCLEMGVSSSRRAAGAMFANNEGFERKREVEAAWRHAAFLTAICSELYRPLTEMQVVSAGGDVWGPYLGGLNNWASRLGISAVYVRWTARKEEPRGVRASAAWAVNHIVGDHLLGQLHGVSPVIVHTMVGTVTGTLNALDDHPLMRVVAAARQDIVAADEAIKPTLYGNLTQGAHLEPYLLDAMRRLFSSGKWQVNQKGARLHFGRDGLHLAWPIGAKEVLEYLRGQDVKGIPANEMTLAEMMHSSGIIAAGADGNPWHMVFPVVEGVPGPSKIMAVRFVRPASVLPPEGDTKPVDWALATGPSAAGPAVDSGGGSKPALAVPPPHVAALPPPPAGAAVDPATGEIDAAPQSASGQTTETKVKGAATDGAQALSSGGAPDVPKAADACNAVPATPPSEQAEASAPASQPAAGTGPGRRAAGNRRNQGAGAIADKPEVTTDVSCVPPEIIATVGLPLAREIAKWQRLWNSGRENKSFVEMPEGLGVRLSFLTDTVLLDISKIVEPLRTNGWLHMVEDSAGRSRPLHLMPFADKEDRGYIIKRAFAKRCGFTLD